MATLLGFKKSLFFFAKETGGSRFGPMGTKAYKPVRELGPMTAAQIPRHGYKVDGLYKCKIDRITVRSGYPEYYGSEINKTLLRSLATYRTDWLQA